MPFMASSKIVLFDCLDSERFINLGQILNESLLGYLFICSNTKFFPHVVL